MCASFPLLHSVHSLSKKNKEILKIRNLELCLLTWWKDSNSKEGTWVFCGFTSCVRTQHFTLCLPSLFIWSLLVFVLVVFLFYGVKLQFPFQRLTETPTHQVFAWSHAYHKSSYWMFPMSPQSEKDVIWISHAWHVTWRRSEGQNNMMNSTCGSALRLSCTSLNMD